MQRRLVHIRVIVTLDTLGDQDREFWFWGCFYKVAMIPGCRMNDMIGFRGGRDRMWDMRRL